MIKGIDDSALRQWIEASLATNQHVLAAGYQGKTLLYQDDDFRIVIKTPHGRGLARYIHTLMLRHEYRVYRKLENFAGAPDCHGLVANKYLAVQYINGTPIREKRPADNDQFFTRLFELVEDMHRRGVAHMDLKKKDNLLVTNEDQPCIIDFGAAVIKKPGFHPLNAYLFALAKRFDYNAWIKHKYHNRDQISDKDLAYHKRTFIERLSSKIKKTYTRLVKN